MAFEIINKQLAISIPNKNKGKFRFKKRDNRRQFGRSFAAGAQKFDKKAYLEWQIGYDAYVKDLESRKKQTSLIKAPLNLKGLMEKKNILSSWRSFYMLSLKRICFKRKFWIL